MVTKNNIKQDINDVETILLALEGVRPEIADKVVIIALARAIWHILQYIVCH